jgi:formate hydrogenlyase subunit 4
VNALTLFHFGLGLVLAPLLPGVINRVKALFGGRKGKPLLQLYFDLAKLVRKGAVYSTTSTWIFKAGPLVGLAALVLALAFLPFAGVDALCSFPGDVFLFAYLLGLARFCTMLAALDTGSSFEGMGAAREALFSALAEPALVLAFLVFISRSGSLTLSAMLKSPANMDWTLHGPSLLLIAAALFLVLLSENCRIPFDDPNTHLELTMIHEVMVLDHSGPDLAFILYGASLKLWIFAALLVNAVAPWGVASDWLDGLAGLACVFLVAVAVGVMESIMARYRLPQVPKALTVAGALALLALVLTWR